jgi:hypothetical protein
MTTCRHVPRNPDACDFCRRMDAKIRAKPTQAPAAECVYRGTPAPPPPGKDVRKRWVLCDSPADPKPLGSVVCGCEGCGPACSSYRTADRDLPPVLRRNLLFHLYPLRGRWHRHAERLRRYAPLFNGRRLVAVAESSHADPVEAVRDALPGYDVLAVPNDPALREVATFDVLFGSLTPAPDEVTLYAQGKGVTYGFDPVMTRWAELLWETHAEYWPVVEDLLRRFPVAGSFLKVGHGWPAYESSSDWHYSGSWFWFRNWELLGRPDSRRIDRVWSGIEPYPSLHYRPHEAGVIFFRGKVPTLQFYPEPSRPHPTGKRFLAEVVEPEFARWQQENRERRTQWV